MYYRYCVGDIIEVIEVFADRPPLIRFLRRNGVSSDMFGEKLTDDFVRNVCVSLGAENEFCLLAPEGNRYCLYTSSCEISDDMLDNALCESFHYNYCRQLGQLEKAEVVVVSGNPADAYIKRLSEDGMRIGDIKPAFLSPKNGWRRYFEIERIG
ncbi:MAG: GH3 auxin-responsive promoter family protein [Ruminiclostridium sp.]|nr:GH3 auxin-responsive promoter family protein [Ruminiclostridium sp.]